MYELQQRITYSEFLEWFYFLLEEEQGTDEFKLKLEHYLAQIAAETRRCWVADPKKVEVEKFLVKLVDRSDQVPGKPEISSDAKLMAIKSKAAWAAHLNMKIPRN